MRLELHRITYQFLFKILSLNPVDRYFCLETKVTKNSRLLICSGLPSEALAQAGSIAGFSFDR